MGTPTDLICVVLCALEHGAGGAGREPGAGAGGGLHDQALRPGDVQLPHSATAGGGGVLHCEYTLLHVLYSVCTLLKNVLLISLNLTDDAIAKLYMT